MCDLSPTMSSEDEIKYELERSLLEWGVDATRGGKRHVEFYRNVMKQVILQCSDNQMDESDQQQMLTGTFDSSVDNVGAIQQLIDAEMTLLLQRGDDTTFVEDILAYSRNGSSLCLVPPYLVKYDRHWKVATQSSHYKIKYEVREEFVPFKRADLDPFERFTRKDTSSVAAYCFTRLMDRITDIGFQAYVCHHVTNEEACRSCHSRDAMQWKEALGDWVHIECRQCGSKYTVQCKSLRVKGKSMQKRIEGGPFSAFRTIQRNAGRQTSDPNQPKQHHYLLFSDRESISELTFGSSGGTKRTVPVFIAEIDSCLPRCVPDSFTGPESGGENIAMYSWIKQVPKSRRLWFHLTMDDEVDIEKMIKNAFEEQFPIGEWDRLVEERSETAEINNTMNVDAEQQQDDEGSGGYDDYDDRFSLQEQADQHAPPSVNAHALSKLKNELEQLRKGGSDSDADWEDAWDSS